MYQAETTVNAAKWWIDHRDDDVIVTNNQQLISWLENRPDDPEAQKYLAKLSSRIETINQHIRDKSKQIKGEAKRFGLPHEW
jgi:ferric-dicitrate binding protein FerR (iron transport regulator)